MSVTAILAFVLLLVLAPAVAGLVVRTKSFLAGRRGAPILQPYYDLGKLLRKDIVYSHTTTWLFRAGPVAVLATVVLAAVLVPLDGRSALLGFAGDMVAFAGLLALGRFALVLSALDTGSSFEGMGASREVTVATFAEPALFLCFIALVLASGDASLSGMLGAPLADVWSQASPAIVLVGISLFVLLLAENARVPVDDPATHLELTMIHEVMVLDHSGPDFGLIQYAGALRLSLFGALIVSVFVPRAQLGPVWSILLLFIGLAVIAVLVGTVESVMARLRLIRVPQLLVGSSVFAALGIILLLGG